MNATLVTSNTVVYPAGYLVAHDPITSISVISNLAERVDHLKMKIDFAKAHDPSIEFSYVEAPDIKELCPLPSLYPSVPVPIEAMNIWVKNFCKVIRSALFDEAFEKNYPLPYPLFSATYQGWAEEEFTEKNLAISNYLKLVLNKAPENSSLEELITIVCQVASRCEIPPFILKPCALFLSNEFNGLSAEKVEDMLYKKLERVSPKE